VSIGNRLKFSRRLMKMVVSKGNTLGGGSYYQPSAAVLFFEPEVEPSLDGLLIETKGLSRI
jgi:hypothetical protein